MASFFLRISGLFWIGGDFQGANLPFDSGLRRFGLVKREGEEAEVWDKLSFLAWEKFRLWVCFSRTFFGGQRISRCAVSNLYRQSFRNGLVSY